MTADSPILSVIDEAIERIDSRRNTFSCMALIDACSLFRVASNEYLHQFELFVLQSHYHRKYPAWWNKQFNPSRQAARLAALRGFRQACIDAATQ